MATFPEMACSASSYASYSLQKARGGAVGLAAVRDLREMRGAAGPEEIEQFEIEVFGGFVLARSAAGLSDSAIRSDVSHLEQVRTWFGRPLWDMEPADADGYFGTVLRAVPPNTRLARAQAIKTYFRVRGAATQGRDPQLDGPGPRVPDR
jgi:hypothetical protein